MIPLNKQIGPLNRETETIEKNQMEILELKSTIAEMKSSQGELKSTNKIANERISKLKDNRNYYYPGERTEKKKSEEKGRKPQDL